MTKVSQRQLHLGSVASLFFAFFGTMLVTAQNAGNPVPVIRQIDAAVRARIENLAGYSVTEHYAVYRGKDEIHPIAEMTVITTYQRDSGKSYVIVSQTGSAIVRHLVLGAILDNEKRLNEPDIRQGAWITSANYEMSVKPGGPQRLNGRDCLVLALIPKRKAPYLIEGTLWVDSRDGSIVQVQGTASKNSSLLTGPTQITRQYANMSGFPEATHVRAVSNSFAFGETTVTIDYQGYRLQIRPPLL